MNARKIKTALLAVILLAGSFFVAFAENNSKRYIIKTEYFDVIYKKPSKQTALMIASNIDDIYLNVRSSLKVEDYYHFKRFPVYIEYSTQDLNGFFTDYPFKHIVLYDTVPRDNLSVYKNNILGVLQHELTHAVSMDVKNKANEVISNVIYDGWGNTFYTAPQSILEGIAVQKESESGAGRLNDPFSTHIIKQAKIENCFPKFQEITGARDIYPSGTIPYIFGGAFTDFVIKKYGKEKFQKFNAALHDELCNYKTIYKNKFGSDLKTDFEEFKNGISIPDVNPDPFKTEGVSDFYTLFKSGKSKNLSQKKSSRVVQTTSFLQSGKAATAWLLGDSNEVWFSTRTETENGPVPSKPEKLFTMTGITKIAFSSDGRYLAVSRILNYSSRKNSVSVYDMEKKQFIYSADNYRDAVILSSNEKYYLASVKTLSQKCTIELFELTKSHKFEKLKEIECPSGNVPLNLTDAGKLNLAFIYRKGLTSSICLYNKELDRLSEAAVPQQLFIHDLNAVVSESFVTGQSGILLSFSYAKKDTLPRLGFLSLRLDDNNFTSAKYHLQTEDISGGVYSPSVYFASKSVKVPSVVFVSKFFDNSKLSVMDTDCFSFEQEPAEIVSVNDLGKETEVVYDGESKTFSPFIYTFRGIFVPLSLIPIYDERFNIRYLGLAGLTWHSKGYHVSAGFDPVTMAYGFTTTIFNSSPSGNSDFHLSLHTAFDESGFRQTEDEMVMKTQIPVFTHSNIVFASTTKFFYGHPDQWPVKAPYAFVKQSDEKTYLTFVNQEEVVLSTLHKTGAGIHETGGVYGGLLFNYTLIDSNQKNESGYGMNLGAEIGFKLPCLLPFKNPEKVTCNLPLSFSASIFPDIERFAGFETSVVLFSKEVQKGTENFILPLYLNRFYFTASYSGSVYYSKMQNMAALNPEKLSGNLKNAVYADTVGLGFVLGLTVNTGTFQPMGAFNIGADILYDINPKKAEENRIHLKLCSLLVF